MAPDLAEARAVRGIIATEYESDPVTGERYLLRAIELNPSYDQAHAWLCETLAIAGRDAEALPACRRAVTLNTGDADRNPWIGVAAVLGEYDGLRENSRFVRILERSFFGSALVHLLDRQAPGRVFPSDPYAFSAEEK